MYVNFTDGTSVICVNEISTCVCVFVFYIIYIVFTCMTIMSIMCVLGDA